MSGRTQGRYSSELGTKDDLAERIADLESRLSRLERTPQLNAGTINQGAIKVVDENGSVRVQLGLLDDGNYGIKVKENGQDTFHEVPFIYTDFVITGETCSNTSYGDLATVGPRVNVSVGSSGRILILATAQAQWTSSGAASTAHDARFDVEFSGANTRSPNETVDPLVGILQHQLALSTGTNTDVMVATITAQATFAGLSPGLTTITMKYARSAGVTDNPQFFRRGLTVVRL